MSRESLNKGQANKAIIVIHHTSCYFMDKDRGLYLNSKVNVAIETQRLFSLKIEIEGLLFDVFVIKTKELTR
jgi:hypothetical protein